MADLRTPLSPGYQLCVQNHDRGEIIYTIEKETGRGGSCLVYDGYYLDNLSFRRQVRIKECYPCQPDIKRNADGHLIPAEENRPAFEDLKEKFRKAYAVNRALLERTAAANAITNPVDIYAGVNHTLYLITDYADGKTLAFDPKRRLFEVFSITKSIALAIKKIHDAGYLYLDLKPDNVFIYPETTELVCLFDFDTLFSFADASEKYSFYPNAFTRGFAAFEQISQSRQPLGKYTDVYGIGATLFYLLYGRVPEYEDKEADAVYPFPVLADGKEYNYPDRLLSELTVFFHRTLANYWGNRFPDMDPVIQSLETLIRLSDPARPFINFTRIVEPACFVGRESEMARLEEWLGKKDSPCIFVTGMGGIGKSTLVRAFLAKERKAVPGKSEPVALYLYFHESLQDTITDDDNLYINTLRRALKESTGEYFDRKLHVLSYLFSDMQCQPILVIDNFDGPVNEDFRKILQPGWRVIIITRKQEFPDDFDQLIVGSISDRQDLHQLFAHYAQEAFTEEDTSDIDYIIDKVQGHTLILELIARQIAESHITLQQAGNLVDRQGFHQMAPEAVPYAKDQTLTFQTIRSVLNELFSAAGLSEAQKQQLQYLAIFGETGIEITDFQKAFSIEDQNELNTLARSGWIHIVHRQLVLHPVILETISTWSWDRETERTINNFLISLVYIIVLEHLKNEPVRDLYQNLETIMDDSITSRICRKILKEPSGPLEQTITDYILEDCKKKDMGVTDTFLLKQVYRYAKQIISQRNRNEVLAANDACIKLMIYTTLFISIDEEPFILKYGQEILTICRQIDLAKNPKTLYVVIKLYDRVVNIYLEQGNLDKAWALLEEAAFLADHNKYHNNLVAAQYYNLLGSFYDTRLGGSYTQDNEYGDQQKLQMAMDRSISCLKKIHSPKTFYISRPLLAEYQLGKINVLARTAKGNPGEIHRLLRSTEKIVNARAMPNSYLRFQYYMVSASIYARIDHRKEKAEAALEKACEAARKSEISDLELIDEIYIPRADLYREWGDYDRSGKILTEGIKICEEHTGQYPYQRAKTQLKVYMLDIYLMGHRFGESYKLLLEIDRENEDHRKQGRQIPVAEGARQYIMEHVPGDQ